MNKKSGILLHITSLPSSYGVGDMGKSAYKFCDFLVETKQSYWQVLPLNPTTSVFGNSPYSSFSAFAGNPLLISPNLLVSEGYVSKNILLNLPSFPKNRVNYPLALKFKKKILNTAFENCKSEINRDDQFKKFCEENSKWLNDYSLFVSLKDHFGDKSWINFPKQIRDRREPHLSDLAKDLIDGINRQKFIQYIFFKQWGALKDYCNKNGVKIIGDLPIYLNHDSSDVWADRQIFKLDNKGIPTVVSGVPPDYFSKTGQRWGNPVYNWNFLEESKYEWWIKRLAHNLKLFDILRLDHFRGFLSYWEIPANEKTAVKGSWISVPSEDFFNTIFDHFDTNKFIAEDLGEITPDVIAMRDKWNLPGMNILQFAFGDDYPNGSFLPHNNPENGIIYTGTHDNNTIIGWWKKESNKDEKCRVKNYINDEFSFENEGINWIFVKLAQRSKAKISITPFQDILGLGDEAKMNKPSTQKGNWEWRYDNSLVKDEYKIKLKNCTEIYSRT